MKLGIETKNERIFKMYDDVLSFSLLPPRLTVRSGNGATVGIPKQHLGKKAIVIILD